MIDSLTPEQESLLPVYAEKWRKIGLSTEPANRKEAERGIGLAYELAGLSPPQEIVWCDSPLSLILTCSVRDSIWGSVRDSVRGSVRDSVRGSVRDSVRGSVRDSVWGSAYGQHDAHWLGYYNYFHSVLGIENLDKLEGLWLIAQNAGWWLPCEDVCFISERHNILRFDEQTRLHCEDGLAIGYPDGWGVYMWHGVRVSSDIILHPEKITPSQIMSEENAEVARIMIERYGQDNFIRDGGFSKIQSDEYGDLYRVEFNNGDEAIVAVHVRDASTDRDYFLYVPPHIQSAHEGVAWTFGYDNPDDYFPLIQT